MNAIELARQAYNPARPALRTERSAESQLFGQITARLQAAIDKGPGAFAQLTEALHDNRRLWAALAVDVADDNNSLPASLRVQILSLADFTMQHSSRVLRNEAGAEALVEINRAVMRGLNGTGDAP